MSTQEETGTVKWFDSKKGFGFITRSSGKDIFVHYSAVEDSGRPYLEEGEQVTFVVGEGRQGPAAQNVRRSNG